MQQTIIHFFDFIKSNNILFIILATLISNRLVDFGNNFIDCIILPLFNKGKLILNKKDQLDGIESHIINVNGFHFKMGRLLVSFIRLFLFSIIAISIYFLLLHKN